MNTKVMQKIDKVMTSRPAFFTYGSTFGMLLGALATALLLRGCPLPPEFQRETTTISSTAKPEINIENPLQTQTSAFRVIYIEKYRDALIAIKKLGDSEEKIKAEEFLQQANNLTEHFSSIGARTTEEKINALESLEVKIQGFLEGR